MNDERFWKIVDMYEHDPESAIPDIVYYDHGDGGECMADYSMLVRDNFGGRENYLKIYSKIERLCKEFNHMGRKEFLKNHKITP